MSETKKARLVCRSHNTYHGGTYEIWDIGNECGIYVDYNPCAFMPSGPETMAFPFDLRSQEVVSWIQKACGTMTQRAARPYESLDTSQWS